MFNIDIVGRDDYIQIGDNIKIYGDKKGRTKIRIDAPKEILILRKKHAENPEQFMRKRILDS